MRPALTRRGRCLQEIGYGEFSATSDRELGQALAGSREPLFQDLYRYVPDKAVVVCSRSSMTTTISRPC